MPIRIVVADDDANVRSALCAVLDIDPRFTVVAQAATGYEAVVAVVRDDPDAVLLDIHMPGGGLEAAREIQTTGHSVVVIAVSASVDASMVAALLGAGTRGVLVKGSLGASFPDLVARCCSGQVILATPVAAEGLKIFSTISVTASFAEPGSTQRAPSTIDCLPVIP